MYNFLLNYFLKGGLFHSEICLLKWSNATPKANDEQGMEISTFKGGKVLKK